jgi:tryptophanyl-tRNA synthetase
MIPFNSSQASTPLTISSSRDAAEWVRDVREFYEKHELNTPQFRLGLWRATFDTDGYKENFEPEIEQTWDRAVPTTIQGVLDRVFSKSYITQISDKDGEELRKKVQNYLATDKSKVWMDEAQGVFEYPNLHNYMGLYISDFTDIREIYRLTRYSGPTRHTFHLHFQTQHGPLQ